MAKDKRDKLSTVLLAIGDPTRREVLKKISRGEPSVLEIAESFPISLPAISKHLKVLERAGLIFRKREGRVHRFKLIGRPMRDAYEWIRNYERFWQVQLDSLEAYLEKAKKEGRSHGKKLRGKKIRGQKSLSKNRSNL
jgi:DNA-binding transcriptional ArsR family regulator